MNRLLLIGAITLAVAGCALVPGNDRNPYDEPQFYERYVDGASPLDAPIMATLEALREHPRAASLHNELGALLIQKGFPRDAEREFERAIDSDRKFYPAWYNLGLARAAAGDEKGAERAFRRTVSLKPGHPIALFQLGLIEEKGGNHESAVRYYAKALRYNPRLMDVRVNPRVVDTKLMHRVLLALYPRKHADQSMQFQPAPAGYVDKQLEAPSPPEKPEEIVPPAPPAPDPSMQPPPTVPPPSPPSSGLNARTMSDIRRPSRAADVDPPPSVPMPLTLQPNASAPAGLL